MLKSGRCRVMRPRYKRLVGRLGRISWSVMLEALDVSMILARPGSYVFGSAHAKQLSRLEEKGWIEKEHDGIQWVYRLTQTGQLALSHGLDPEKLWSAPWDGKWRMFMFDLPARQAAIRQRLREWLREERFGCLQGSLWVRPHEIDPDLVGLNDLGIEATQMITVEATPVGSHSPRQIVSKAWDFESIRLDYQSYLASLKEWRAQRAAHGDPDRLLARQAVDEWNKVALKDPFLPDVLLPRGYPGKHAWRERSKFLSGK